MVAVKHRLPYREQLSQQTPEGDKLAPARGLIVGLGVGASAWAGIIVVAIRVVRAAF